MNIQTPEYQKECLVTVLIHVHRQRYIHKYKHMYIHICTFNINYLFRFQQIKYVIMFLYTVIKHVREMTRHVLFNAIIVMMFIWTK